jgi:hypothetical protein
MSYREEGLPVVVRLGSSSLLPSVSSTSDTQELADGRGAKSYDGEKVWSSVNHSVLSGRAPMSAGPGMEDF